MFHAVPHADARTVVDSAWAVLAKLQQQEPSTSSGTSRKAVRGPHLAAVDLTRRQHQLGQCEEQDVAAAVLDYFEKHGHLVSCAMDLRQYTAALHAPSADWLGRQLREWLERQLSSDAAKDLRRHVSCQQLLHDLALPGVSSHEQRVSHAVQLMRLFGSSQQAYEGLDPRERGPADELIALAAGALMAPAGGASPRGRLQALLGALLVVEVGVAVRPFSSPMRLAAASLYGLLGCPLLAAQHVCKLEVKNMQLDSVASHHLLPLLLGCSPPSDPALQVR